MSKTAEIAVTPIKSKVKEKAKNISKSLLSKLWDQVSGTIKHNACYKVMLNGTLMTNGILQKWFKRFPDSKTFNTDIEGCFRSENYYDITFFKGTPIIIHLYVSKDDKYYIAYLLTSRRKKDIANMNKFMSIITKMNEEYSIKECNATARSYDGCGAQLEQLHNSLNRSESTIYLKKSIRQDIYSHIKHFMDRKSWFSVHQIPYHTGILLYGPPGTGKSSIVSSLCKKFNLYTIYVDTAKGFCNIYEPLNFWVDKSDRYVAIVVEDCDTLFSPIAKDAIDYDEHEYGSSLKAISEKSMSAMLNVMDGSRSRDNIIYIFTTNYPERIDPRFLRAGRIDKQVEIGYVCNEVMNQFLNAHFGKPMPENRTVKDNVTVAQMNINLMNEEGYEDIIEQYTEEK